MKKLKNEAALTKKALEVAEIYAQRRGYKKFGPNDSSNVKVEALYRLLVSEGLVAALPKQHEDQPNMKHKLAIWVTKQLPEDHPLLK
ncbi:MAG: DUF5062 domain-containing protein [Gammaproteobacteria bacterium CG22_combo_CG10-13_8_21_14_all_40_8]|nr:MAG: DUF5062 domain-containing protein [Gammaproteobacteria bacterium CG22_combo_CG10-13_8_21_14_all_40_8]